MSNRKRVGLRLVAASLYLIAAAVAQAAPVSDSANQYRAPRNEYGQPDLRGVWNFSSDVQLERPAAVRDKAYETREERQKSNAQRMRMFERLSTVSDAEHRAGSTSNLANPAP